MEPTSEQELKQLLDEGRVTQEEYQELKQAMAERDAEKKSDCDINIKGNFQLELCSQDLGKLALILALGGIILPMLGYTAVDLLAGPDAGASLGPWVFLFYGMEIPALVIGSLSWKTVFGKAGTVTAAIVLLLSLNFWRAKNAEYQFRTGIKAVARRGQDYRRRVQGTA